MQGVAQRVEDLDQLLAPVIAALGYELWGVELNARPRHSLLRLFIDSPDGITVDDCAAVSRQASATLDVADPIKGAYTLEVSSPGWDRPLFRPEQYRRYVGSKLRLRLARLVEGQRNVAGVLRGIDDDCVEVELAPEKCLRVPWGAIRKANLDVDEE
jgi:ribosome maturation factor RimP